MKAGSLHHQSPGNSFGDGSSQPSSLFGEVHLTEIKKLEENLKVLENDKNVLSVKLNDSQCVIEKMKTEMSLYQNKLSKIVDILSKEGDIDDVAENDYAEVQLLKKLLLRQISESSVGQLQQQLNNMKNQQLDSESRAKNYENDIHVLNSIAEEAYGNLCSTQEDMMLLSEELAALYHHVCHVNGETPNRIMLDHAASESTNQLNNSGSSSLGPNSLKLEQFRDRLNNSNLLQTWKAGTTSSVECKRALDTVRDQLRHLKNAIEMTIETKTQRSKLNEVNAGISASPSTQTLASGKVADLSSIGAADAEEMQEQNVKYKALLSTKREQIATLRTVLKANKQTAEVALANLKSKYETEKAVVTETMAKLRNELKALKEDAATFASLRSMFAARCEEYVTQIDELQRQLLASEEEKKTLNSLLRIAIQQKLSITQKLEDYEMDRERTSLSSPRIGSAGKDRSTARGGSSRSRGGNVGFRNLSARQPSINNTPSAPLGRGLSSNSNSQSNQNSPKRSF